MKHRILSLALTALMLILLTVSALAADTGYTGVVDPETGEPYDTQAAEAAGDRVAITGAMYFDWARRDYVYPIPDGLGEIRVTAADGMILTKPVSIQTGSVTGVTVSRNGSEYTGSLSSCAEAGEYVISVLTGGQKKRIMSFTLVGRTTNAIHDFIAPDGFYVVDAQRGGESVYMDRYSVRMEEEGAYSIEYSCSSTGMSYKLETSIDRTPPALTFHGKVDGQGRVRSKLEFSGLQSEDRIYLTRSGTAVTPEFGGDGTGTIYDPGNYVMLVMDAAGNTIEYNFIILQYFNLQSWIFFLIVLAVVAAVVIYIVLQRKRLKIG